MIHTISEEKENFLWISLISSVFSIIIFLSKSILSKSQKKSRSEPFCFSKILRKNKGGKNAFSFQKIFLQLNLGKSKPPQFFLQQDRPRILSPFQDFLKNLHHFLDLFNKLKNQSHLILRIVSLIINLS